MAFYELHLNIYLKPEIPLEILQTLQYMISKEKLNETEYSQRSKLELFNNNLWATFLTRDVPYFPFLNNSGLIKWISGDYVFYVNCSFLSKDNKIITQFIDWLQPYFSNTNDFIGYYREYEEELRLLSIKEGHLMIRYI